MKKVTQVLVATIILGVFISGCGLGESQRAEPEGRASPQQTRREVASEPRQDERLERLASLSFQSALNEDWRMPFSIFPTTDSGEPDLGIVRQWQGEWVAGFESGFAGSEFIGVEEIDADTVRFFVAIWRNANPEEPFAPRQPDTPTYRFYVDLSERQFRDSLRSAIEKEQRATGAFLPAMDMAGSPVPANWWEFASSTES